MKSSKRNLIILLSLLCLILYGTSLVVGSTVVPSRKGVLQEHAGLYQRNLQQKLLMLVKEKRFPEAEIVFRRLLKLDPRNRYIRRLGSLVLYHNEKYNEAEVLLRNMLLRNPGDFICRNNYAMVLTVKKQPRALKEFFKAWQDSGGSSFIETNMRRCAGIFKLDPPPANQTKKAESAYLETIPLDAICIGEEKI